LNYGYDNASMAAVAEVARVSTATLYLDYEDKQTLFLEALMMQARFIVDYHKLIDSNQPHGDSMSSLLFSISRVLADPDFLWYHYAVMTSELSDAPDLVEASRHTRTHNEGFWIEVLEQLILTGHLKPHDTMLSMNLLLGATQRGSIQALLLFGREGAETEKLADLSVASTAFVLRLFGTQPT
jgi:AcrR family transcriptional regulator